LFDYLPQSSIVIAATNQKEMIDDALLRRFDNIITFSLPTEKEIKELIDLTLKDGQFKFKNKSIANQFIKECNGLSYYSIQKTLINAIKKSLFDKNRPTNSLITYIDTTIWMELIQSEKKSLGI
jgi:AAA+ superfamily predicted ATPase